MNSKITPEIISALRALRQAAAGIHPVPTLVREAINDLDNGGVFAAIDEATDYSTTGTGLPTLAPGEEAQAPFSSTHPRAARELGQLISGE
jgi:hypothetical protein